MANPVPVNAPVAVSAKVESTPAATPVTPQVVMSDQDAYILTRLASQPKTLEAIEVASAPADPDRNRLSLDAAIEKYSYDCTNGKSCRVHQWVFDDAKQQWSYKNHGEYVFRWGWKHKLAVDRSLSVRGWLIVSRQYFKEAPNYLFSANGAVEVGDNILYFMPVKQALALRQAPGKRSLELIRSRMTRTKQGVMMAGATEDPRYFMPEGSGTSEETDSDTSVPGLQEGRDF